jgi:hypothetical protein
MSTVAIQNPVIRNRGSDWEFVLALIDDDGNPVELFGVEVAAYNVRGPIGPHLTLTKQSEAMGIVLGRLAWSEDFELEQWYSFRIRAVTGPNDDPDKQSTNPIGIKYQ